MIIESMSNHHDYMRSNDSDLLYWSTYQPKPANNEMSNFPKPLSGHSFTIIGSHAYTFGGLVGYSKSEMENLQDDAEPLPCNIMYRLSLDTMEWQKLAGDEPVQVTSSNYLSLQKNIPVNSDLPLPRWKHTATVVDETKILIFGGLHSTDHRLNDVWVFDTISFSWSQPNSFHNQEASIANQLSYTSWNSVPSPRSSHSATYINGLIYVFGGHGGIGYSRRDLDDIYTLDPSSWTWNKIAIKGNH